MPANPRFERAPESREIDGFPKVKIFHHRPPKKRLIDLFRIIHVEKQKATRDGVG